LARTLVSNTILRLDENVLGQPYFQASRNF